MPRSLIGSHSRRPRTSTPMTYAKPALWLHTLERAMGWTTCPTSPSQNILKVAIRAGEKIYDGAPRSAAVPRQEVSRSST